MPGRPLTRQSYKIIADLTQTSEWWDGCLDRLACGDSPKEVADEHAILFGVFMRWIEAEAERKAQYDAALRIAAEGHAHDTLRISDGRRLPGDDSESEPDVQRDKLRIDTRLKLASKWDRARYGEKEGVASGGVTVIVQKFAGEAVAIHAGGDTITLPAEQSTRVIDVSRDEHEAHGLAASPAVEIPHPLPSSRALI